MAAHIEYGLRGAMSLLTPDGQAMEMLLTQNIESCGSTHVCL